VVEGQINGGAYASRRHGRHPRLASSADANRLGIDYARAPGLMGTANGTAIAYKVKLDNVRVGDIVANNVDASCWRAARYLRAARNELPQPNGMKRVGETMVLIKRF